MRSEAINNVLKEHSANELSSLCKKFLLSISSLFLLAVHLPFPSIGKKGLEFTPNVTTWIAFSFMIGIGCYQIAIQNQLRYTKLTVIFAISCTLLTIPSFYGDTNWQESYQRVIVLWSGLLLFLILQQFNFKDKKHSPLWFVLLAVLIEIGLGYTQILFFVLDKPFGFIATHLPLGIFQKADITASFLATGLAIAAYLLPSQTKISAHFFLVSIPSLSLPLLFVLPSLLGWVASIITLLLLMPYCYKHLKSKVFYSWLSSIILGALFATFLFKIIHTRINNADEYLLDVLKTSSQQVIQLRQAMDMLFATPLCGFGYGQFENKYMQLTASKHLKDPSYPAGYSVTKHPKNEVMLWITEGGILPLIAILFAATTTLLKIYKSKKLAAFIMFVPIALHLQLGAPFSYSFVHWLTFIILLWSIDDYSKLHTYTLKFLTRSTIRLASLLFPITISMFMLLTLQANYWLAQYEKTDQLNFNLLNNIVMPLPVQGRIDSNIYTTYLRKGIENKHPRLIILYINWAKKMIEIKPRLNYYLMLIKAYRALNDEKNAHATIAEAKFLFPSANIK